MRMLALLAALASPTLLAAAPVPKALHRSASSLNGTWELVESYSNDTRMKRADQVRWTIDGEALTVEGRNNVTPAGFVANATRTVKRPEGGTAGAIDYTISPPDGAPQSIRPGVFELDGDTLTICISATHNGPRPAECKPADGTILYVLKRVTDK